MNKIKYIILGLLCLLVLQLDVAFGQDDGCPQNITLNQSHPTSMVVKSENSISSGILVNENLDVEYKASDIITLTDKFHAKPNSNFRAVAEDVTCANVQFSSLNETCHEVVDFIVARNPSINDLHFQTPVDPDDNENGDDVPYVIYNLIENKSETVIVQWADVAVYRGEDGSGVGNNTEADYIVYANINGCTPPSVVINNNTDTDVTLGSCPNSLVDGLTFGPTTDSDKYRTPQSKVSFQPGNEYELTFEAKLTNGTAKVGFQSKDEDIGYPNEFQNVNISSDFEVYNMDFVAIPNFTLADLQVVKYTANSTLVIKNICLTDLTDSDTPTDESCFESMTENFTYTSTKTNDWKPIKQNVALTVGSTYKLKIEARILNGGSVNIGISTNGSPTIGYFDKRVTIDNNAFDTYIVDPFDGQANHTNATAYILVSNPNSTVEIRDFCLILEGAEPGPGPGLGDEVFWDIDNNVPNVINNSNYQFGTNLNFITPTNAEKDLFSQGIRPFKTPSELAAAFDGISENAINGVTQEGCQLQLNPSSLLTDPVLVYRGGPNDIDFTALATHHTTLQTDGTGIWRNEYLNQIRNNYSINRYMIWAGTNDSFESNWASRVKQYDCGQNSAYRLLSPIEFANEAYDFFPPNTNANGNPILPNDNVPNTGRAVKPLAYEWMIDFSNKTDNGMWINIPHEVFNAFDHQNPAGKNEYAIKLAILIKHGVDMGSVNLRSVYGNNYNGLSTATQAELANIQGAGIVCQPLDHNLEIHVEYSNEIWNFSGSHAKQTYYAHNEGVKLLDASIPEFQVTAADPSQFSRDFYRYGVENGYYWFKYKNTLNTSNDLIAKYSAYGHILTWQAFKYVFGDSDRVKSVLGQWHIKNLNKNQLRNDDDLFDGTINTMDQLKLKYDIINSFTLNPDQIRPDFVAIAPYFASNHKQWSGNENSRTNYWQDMAMHVDSLTDQVKEIRKVLQSHDDIFYKDSPGSESVQLISYEGGQHILTDCKQANSKPKSLPNVCNDMYDIYSLYLSKLKEDMPTFVHFTHTGATSLDVNITSSQQISGDQYTGDILYKKDECWGATELVDFAGNFGNNPGGYVAKRSFNTGGDQWQSVDVVVNEPFGNTKLQAIQDHVANPNYGSCLSELRQIYQSDLLEALEFNVQPNPFSNSLTLKTEKENGQMRIVDMTGRILLQQEVAGKITTIDTKTLKPGYYLVEVENGGRTQTQKIIKH